MKKMKFNALFVAIGFATTSYAWAESNVSSKIETISVYGQFNPIDKNSMPSSVSLMNKADIASVVGNTALDVLAQVPGITIKKSGNIQEIFLRGAESNFVIIQIDGVQVNNPLDARGGSFDLSTLGKDTIARVEVIKGAQSSIYGSDALAGVINFITFDEQQEGGKVSVGYLNDGQKSATFKTGFGGWNLALNGIDTDEQAAGDSQRLAEAALQGKLTLTDSSATQLNIRFSDYQNSAFPDQSGGAEFAEDTTKERKEGQTLSASLRHQININEDYQMSLQLEHLATDDSLTSPGIAPYFMAPPAFTENDYTVSKFRWLNAVSVDNVSATVGMDYKDENGETSGYLEMFGQQVPTNYRLSRTNVAGFIDAKVDIAEASLFLGVRLDKPEDSDNETTWKLGVNYPMTNNLRLFANTGESFKLPSLYALGNNMIGNTELLPETATNVDLGVEWASEQVDISLAVFDYHYKNLIDFDSETFSLVNRASVKTQGAELILSTDLTSSSTLGANATYADVQAGEGELLSGRPQWQGGASLHLQWTDDFSAYISANYIGESSATSLHGGDFSTAILSSYYKVDLSANWQVNEGFDIDFFVTNALDKKYYYAIGFAGPEQGLGVKVNWLAW